jgi:hypothetical protein
VIGTRRLTEAGRAAGISDRLRAAARLATIGYAAATAVGVVVFWHRDRTVFHFVDTAIDVARHLADAMLAFVAARHFARCGWRLGAPMARVLGFAMLAAIVAKWALTRPHGDVSFTVAAQYTLVAAAMNAALWLAKLAVFVSLCVALLKPRPLA